MITTFGDIVLSIVVHTIQPHQHELDVVLLYNLICVIFDLSLTDFSYSNW